MLITGAERDVLRWNRLDLIRISAKLQHEETDAQGNWTSSGAARRVDDLDRQVKAIDSKLAAE
jgi:hypothetical protein